MVFKNLAKYVITPLIWQPLTAQHKNHVKLKGSQIIGNVIA